MDEAERSATEFVKTKRPNAKVSVLGVERKTDNEWTVRCSTFEETEHGGASDEWTVKVEGTEVVSYNMKNVGGIFFAST